MKRIGNLKNTWCNYESLIKAFYEVKKNKSYHHSILQYENNLAVNLHNILEKLENETYEVKPTRKFYVYDPKERLIEAPHLEDRIVQHALLNSIRDVVEKRFIDNTYACRIGKGTHKASSNLRRNLISYKNEGYYLKVDISKFFYSIDHSVLIEQLKSIIKCNSTLNLLIKFFKNDEGKGLPLGSVTSQLLANLALTPVDHYVKRVLKIKHYVRYMDDFILLSKSKKQLTFALAKIKQLATALKLTLNKKTIIAKIKDGIDFVGYKTWYNNSLIRKRSLYKVKRVMGKNPDVNRVSSYLAHSKNTNSLTYVSKIILTTSETNKEFVKFWLFKNRPEVYNAIFQG